MLNLIEMKCVQYASTQMMSGKPLNEILQQGHFGHLNRKLVVDTKKMPN